MSTPDSTSTTSTTTPTTSTTTPTTTTSTSTTTTTSPTLLPAARRLSAHGLSCAVPQGWDVRIEQRQQSAVPAPGSEWPMGGYVHPTLHAGSSTLPPNRGDYGSGYVEIMRPTDVFVCLAEFDHEAGDTAMFLDGLPRTLSATDFHPEAQQRVIPGMCGSQRFFSTDDRAFCLYVVLGSWVQRRALTDTVNNFLSTLEVTPR